MKVQSRSAVLFQEDKVQHIYAVLREKEVAIERLRKEIAALRLACPLLQDEGGSTPISFEAGIEGEETGVRIRPADEKDECLARIRARLLEAGANTGKQGSGKSVLLQFRRAALGASRTFMQRVLDSRLLEREPQRKVIRTLFERLGLSDAA